jgi:hypothetical protein
MSSKLLKIHLGPDWNRFSLRRGDLELLGTVQDGMTIGAFGRHPDGRYVQVNGDVERTLNASRVKLALAKAEPGRLRRPRPAPRATATPPPATVIVVKRRRIPLAVPANLEPSLDTTE